MGALPVLCQCADGASDGDLIGTTVVPKRCHDLSLRQHFQPIILCLLGMRMAESAQRCCTNVSAAAQRTRQASKLGEIVIIFRDGMRSTKASNSATVMVYTSSHITQVTH